ncbi:MAG: outer membrane beta-barrel protein [Beijerinckiaceae bacterium]|nr:outer membrane beta-barrel protein [Beijerinckiaceae bacterium]
MACKDISPKFALVLAAAAFLPLTALGYLPVAAARADFQPPFPPDVVPLDDRIDFASGWYVRGDIAYARESYPKVLSAFTFDPSLSPAYTFQSAPSAINTYSVGAGFGYKFNGWFRTDLVLDYRAGVQSGMTGPSITCITGITNLDPLTYVTGTCTSHVNADIHRWDLLANAYFDLGTWQGFTPYIGAGAGVAWSRNKQSVTWTMGNGLPYQVSSSGFYFNLDRSLGSMTYRFAWALMAGVAFPVTDHLQIDLGYRYLDLGTVSGISAATFAPASQKVIANEVRGGLRYMID